MQPDHLIAGRYRLIDRIGAGAMGEVWRARDTTLERDVAVKIVDLTRPTDASAAARFHREATATAGLHHPNIVQVFDAGFDDPTEAYLVMELLEGPTLSTLLGKVDWRTAVRLTAEIADGLAAAHRVGVLHRDIKPGNVMLDRDSPDAQAKIVDFGIARLLEGGDVTLTQPTTALGTAAYMSPEQATGAELTTASDIYSLGCLLFALLTGRPPFVGEHPLAVLQQHVYKSPPRPSDLDPRLPTNVDVLVGRMMARDPADRPTADEVVSRFERVLGPDRGLDATRAMPLGAVQQDPTAATRHLSRTEPEPIVPAPFQEPLPSRPRSDPPTRGRRGLGWVIALLLILIGLLVAALVILRPGSGEPGQTATPSSTSSAPGSARTSRQPTSAPASSAPATSSAPTSQAPTSQAPSSAASTQTQQESQEPTRASTEPTSGGTG